MKHKCHWCEAMVEKIDMDHVVPRSAGGRDWPTNLVESCRGCNRSKNRNFWIKTKTGIEKYKKPRMFISFEEDEVSKKVVITTVLTLNKKKNKRAKEVSYEKYGIELTIERSACQINPEAEPTKDLNKIYYG